MRCNCLSAWIIVEMLDRITPIDRESERIKSLLLDDVMGTYQGAIIHTKFLLDIELAGMPTTYNHYFNENLQKR